MFCLGQLKKNKKKIHSDNNFTIGLASVSDFLSHKNAAQSALTMRSLARHRLKAPNERQPLYAHGRTCLQVSLPEPDVVPSAANSLLPIWPWYRNRQYCAIRMRDDYH